MSVKKVPYLTYLSETPWPFLLVSLSPTDFHRTILRWNTWKWLIIKMLIFHDGNRVNCEMTSSLTVVSFSFTGKFLWRKLRSLLNQLQLFSSRLVPEMLSMLRSSFRKSVGLMPFLYDVSAPCLSVCIALVSIHSEYLKWYAVFIHMYQLHSLTCRTSIRSKFT